MRAIPASPSDAAEPYECACGRWIEPVRFSVLGVDRLLRGTCQPCFEAAEAAKATAQAAREREDHLIRYRREFPPSEMGLRLLNASFESFTVRAGTEVALNRAREFAAALPSPSPPALMLWGGVGNGKSFLGAAITHVARGLGLAVAWVSTPEWLEGLANMEDREKREQLLRMAARAELLVLDELAGGKQTAARSGYLRRIIDARYRQLTPTVITSNANPDSLAASLDEAGPLEGVGDGTRLVDRLADPSFARLVQVTATSYRREAGLRRHKRGAPGC
ncbi:MAG: ATP-binding protein [Dehalococcoidia bacterium]|nr:ATP-binding protein [Dehalococcoidia bacterium]